MYLEHQWKKYMLTSKHLSTFSNNFPSVILISAPTVYVYNDGSQNMFLWRNMANYSQIIPVTPYLEH